MSYFVSNAKAIIPVADGAENDVPLNPSEQDDEKEVDVYFIHVKILNTSITFAYFWQFLVYEQIQLKNDSSKFVKQRF